MDKTEQIKIIKDKIASLDLEKQKLVSQLEQLEKQPPALYVQRVASNLLVAESSHKINSYSVSSQQITLFRSLFRGREDVYPRLWVSRKTGKAGYSPVCKNEGHKNICNKYTVKCSECSNREFASLTDEVIRKHLQGEYIIGTYPMLADETCWFLAVDFDKESWQADVLAFKKTCLEQGVPISIERSRSGNGAHVWIFFNEPVPAGLARKLGSFLITETMSRRYQLDMKSYDRLFPNQDTMPKGGFGNLIVLPFQKQAIIKGNTVFIDDNGNPYTDQWQFLSQINKMFLLDVERIVRTASEKGQIIGVSMSPADENDPPWTALPSGKSKYKPVINNLPPEVEIVLANRIYIKVNNLPSVLLNQIKRLAAFQNPEFYKKQNMRLSTNITPRVICCAEILDNYLALPRGCLNDLICLLTEYGIKTVIKDERFLGKKAEFKFSGALNNEQKIAAGKILKNDVTIFVAPPGTGKTIIGIYIIAERKTNTLILVHRKPILDQWRTQLAMLFNINLKDIGQIGAGKDKPNGILDVAMIQSLEKKGIVNDRIADYGNIIVDECHHISAISFERVLKEAKAKYILGLTATPYRRDGHQPIIHMQCGPIGHYIKKEDINQGITDFIIFPRTTQFSCEWTEDNNIADIWPKLINDEERNSLIINDIIKSVEAGRFPIILTERREHLELLAKKLEGRVEHIVILYGGLKAKARKEMLNKLSQCPDESKKIILATGSYIGEGFDEPRLDTLFITMPISFRGRIVQYAGRLHREYQNKNDVQIYDYVDEKMPILLKMYQRRLKTYKAMDYRIDNMREYGRLI